MKNKYETDISGVPLTVLADESEDEFKEIVRTVDDSINEMMNTNSRVTRMQATLLMCLDYRSRVLSLERENDALKKQIEKLTKKNI